MAKFDGVNILLVDDDEVDRKCVEKEFTKISNKIIMHASNNGAEALAHLATLNPIPDVIILDLKMPKMNGIEFLNILRSNPEFSAIKVYLLVGKFSTKEKLAIQDLSVAGCIVKPLQHADALNIFWTVANDFQNIGRLIFTL